MEQQRNNRGFSLVELMVVIAILAIVGAIAMPMMSRWIPNQRLKAATRDIVSAMAQAKAEAIRRGEQVTLAFAYHENVQNPCANLTAGEQLFVMFLDKSSPRDAKCDADAPDEIVMQSAMPNRVVLDEGKTTCGGDPFALGFNARALPVRATGGGMGACTIRLCVADSRNEAGSPCRSIVVSSAGRVRTELD